MSVISFLSTAAAMVLCGYCYLLFCRAAIKGAVQIIYTHIHNTIKYTSVINVIDKPPSYNVLNKIALGKRGVVKFSWYTIATILMVAGIANLPIFLLYSLSIVAQIYTAFNIVILCMWVIITLNAVFVFKGMPEFGIYASIINDGVAEMSHNTDLYVEVII